MWRNQYINTIHRGCVDVLRAVLIYLLGYYPATYYLLLDYLLRLMYPLLQ